MLVIRFSRTGKRNQAHFKIVVAEKSAPIKGRFVEQLGSWNPHQKEAVLKEDRIKYWLEKGAQASDSVHNLLVTKGVIKDKKRTLTLKAKKVKEGEGKDADKSPEKAAGDTADKKDEDKPTEEKKEESREAGSRKAGKEDKPVEEEKKEDKPDEEKKPEKEAKK